MSSYDIVITADESCMHNYNMSFMAGFLSCTPRDLMPQSVVSYIEKKFFSEAPTQDGKAQVAILSLRKIEAYLSELGFHVVVTSPQSAHKFDAPLYLLSTMDPLGLGPATTTMMGLTGGKLSFNHYFFQQLVSRIKSTHTHAKVMAGGPGIWEFEILPEEQAKMKVDCLFFGAVEGSPKEFWEAAVKGIAPPVYKNKNIRPDPLPIKGPSFWGMVEISRGCGRGCQFCDFELMSGFKWIPKDFILKEVAVNAASPLVSTITLLSEDTLRYGTQIREWKPNGKIVELVKEIKKFNLDLSFTHCCLATALANPEVTEAFSHEAGLSEKKLTGFQTGIESGSPRIVRRYMQGKLKPWEPEDWPEVVQQGMAIMVDNYIIPHATLVMGLEGETSDDVMKTIELVDSLHHYPSVILPLFFVPLSILKERAFTVGLLKQEHKELLATCAKHTAKWARRLPNWSGSLGFADRFVFTAGAAYSFQCLDELSTGKKKSTARKFAAAASVALKSHLIGAEEVDYWQKTKRSYPVVSKIDRSGGFCPSLPMVSSEIEQ
ncbi:MAG: B12-binding domain-containing radical SAM protein [Candidatus Aenigmarchaeota archaeon]|nr:B12-binding domain-containing radical SAM protein [Candidatus Aenigmarchaeota archaeon]